MIKNYINLTNGIEAVQQYGLREYSFIRIQSTACEQHLWDRLFQDLDYDFLMNVALGNECVIYDYGTRKPVPRAIYQGVEFIKFALNKYWYGIENDVYIRRSQRTDYRGANARDYFNKEYELLSDITRKKLKYFQPYLCGSINIRCVTSPTIHDNDKEFYANILREVTAMSIGQYKQLIKNATSKKELDDIRYKAFLEDTKGSLTVNTDFTIKPKTFYETISRLTHKREYELGLIDQEAYIPTDDNGNYTDRERVKQCKEDFYASLRKIFGSA